MRDMTFEEFRASARHVGTMIFYEGHLVIEKANNSWPPATREKGDYFLCIGNREWVSSDLTKLERHLFDFGVSEGIF